MAGNLIEVGAVVDLGAYKAGMQEAVATTQAATQEISASFEKANVSSHAAMAGMAFAVEDSGIKMSRHFRRLLAEMPLVNAAFSALMPIFAIGVGIDILGRAVDKVIELANEYQRLSESAKKSMDEVGNATKKLIADDEKLLAIRRNTELVGKSSVEQAILRAHWAAEDSKDTAATTEELLKQYNAAKLLVAAADQENSIRQHILKRKDADKSLGPAPSDSDLQAALKQIEILEAAYGKGLQDLQQKGAERREKDKEEEAKAGQASLQNSIAVNLAKLEANKKTADATILQETQAIKELEAAHKISAEDALTLNKSLIDKKYQQDEAALNAKLAQLRRDPALNAKQIIAVQGEIRTASIQHYTELEKLDAEYYKQVEHNGQEAVTKAAARLHQMIQQAREAQDAAIKDQIEGVKQASEGEIQLIEQRFERGKITQQQEIALIAKAKETELELEKLAQQKRFAIWQGDVKKQAQIQAEINKIIAQSSLIETKAVTDGLKAQQQQYRQVFQSIGNTFKTEILSMASGTETVAQAFAKMFNSLISGLASYIAQKAEKKAEEWAIDKLFHIKSVTGESGAAAGKAAAAGFASAMASLPFPANVSAAPGVATAAGASAMSFGLAGLASLAIGTNYVPMDGLAYLHKGEQVIPASKQGPGYSGGGGSSFNVTYNVSAIDAEGTKDFLNKNAKAHVDMLMKQAKRRGWKP